MNFNKETMENIIDLIRKIVQEELQKQQKSNSEHLETYRNVKVVAVTNETDGTTVVATSSANVQDMATKETIYDVSNESGKILKEGDIVRLYETNGDFCNRYIGLKC